MMNNSNEINALILELVRERFPDAEIETIEISEDVDADGDDILRVKVIFEAEGERLDASATSSILRYLRPKLSDIGVTSFPIMSFISREDVAGAAA